MILTRTPLRISFAGGGTDLPAFYREDVGAVFSATITAYMYLAVSRKFDSKVRLSYSRTENVETANELEHDLAREALEMCSVERGIEVVSVADAPGGTGLGSSSAYTVGLLKALDALRGITSDPQELAENACAIEIDKCGHPIGKQDQYAAAFGGLRLYEFYPDGVKVNPTINAPWLEDNLMLIYLGQTRDANGMLKGQPIDHRLYCEMAELAHVMVSLVRTNEVDEFARVLSAAWRLKCRVANINPEVHSLIALAQAHGALAGKLCGAGGTGFLLLVVPPECRDRVRSVLTTGARRELPFTFEPHGSQVIYAS